ncbi:aspartyl-tRNA synthetase [Methylocystis hirsuta]|uniref:Aspartyl-tRNA synthetase n=1 Tax=Methylocystis hirsuta TaxID=369798 RepID=A0A3M9XQD6_9HYPH|nr:aspartyl-tRNA synthetase [Methylocystis hirsuta]RNJ49886.1 aspartyl-tRNA synthetase [Methylocystis hirsuta]
MRSVTLTSGEISVLMKQDPTRKNRGGWQLLIVTLQEKLDAATGSIFLDRKDLERIPRYAFDYKNGGWESYLKAVFGRTLGPKLGRP